MLHDRLSGGSSGPPAQRQSPANSGKRRARMCSKRLELIIVYINVKVAEALTVGVQDAVVFAKDLSHDGQ